MKRILTIALLVSAGMTSFAQIKKVPYRGAFAPAPSPQWTDLWTNFDPQNTLYPFPTVFVGTPPNSSTPAGTVITTNTTWTNNNVYEIRGLVYVKSGVTLTIQPGTIIRGSSSYPNSSLIITKGAKIIAEGTPSQPIVFTSNNAPGSRSPGNWGGIILLGKSQFNGTSASSAPTPSTYGIGYIEGITPVNEESTSGRSSEYGGGASPVLDDNSGILKYVRIEFGGYIFGQNTEINGLTLGAVGRGTTIDYVQCSFINDDSFEWFGGTVNCSHLVSYRSVDDEWDTDNGFSGTVQFALGVRDPQIGDGTYAQSSGGSTSEGYESDNDANGSENTPQTKALFANITNIGPLRGDNSLTNQNAIYPAFRRAARLRRNTALKIFNSILADYPTGLGIDNNGSSAAKDASGNTTSKNAEAGRLKFKYNIISGVASGKLAENTGGGNYGTFVARDFVLSNNNDSTGSAAKFLVRPYGTATYPNQATFTTADYRPRAVGSAAAADSLLATIGADWQDSSFTLNDWTADTCIAPAAPSAITGKLSVIKCDSTQTYSISSYPGVTLIWTITGTGNTILSGNGTNSVTVKLKANGILSVSAGNGCATSSSSSISLTVLATDPAAPASITQTAVSGACGNNIIRYTAPVLPTGATGYLWTLPSGPVGSTGSLDSGAIDLTGRIIRIKYTSNDAAGSLDSIKLKYTWGCGTNGSAVKGFRLTKVALTQPPAPTITITSLGASASTCGRVFRYTAGALAAGTSTRAAATGWEWEFTGALGAVATIDSGTVNSRVIRVTFASPNAKQVGDSVKCRYTSACGVGAWKASLLTNTVLGIPRPASITAALVSNVCGARVYRYTAPLLPAATTSATAATGYKWTLPTGLVGATATLDSGVVDGNGDIVGRTIKLIYTSNLAAEATDSIYVQYNSLCGLSQTRGLKLTNTALAGCTPPPAPSARISGALAVGDQLYPNPNNGKFRLTVNTGISERANVIVRLFDMTGKVVAQYNAINTAGVINSTYDAGQLPNGVYTVQYTLGNQTKAIKMFIQK